MAFALPALAIAGPIIGATGALVQGAATQNASDYQAAVANNNAIIAGYNAGLATQSGEVQAENKSRQGAEKQASIKAATAANGIDVNSGSAVTTQEGEHEVANTDTATTMHNALLQAYGYRTQQTGFEAQSKLDTQQGDSAAIGSYFGAGGSLVGNASSFGNPSSSASSSIAQLFSGGGSAAIPAGNGFAVSP